MAAQVRRVARVPGGTRSVVSAVPDEPGMERADRTEPVPPWKYPGFLEGTAPAGPEPVHSTK